jgi:hypothetical protein
MFHLGSLVLLLIISGCQAEGHSVSRIEQPITGGTVSTTVDDAAVRLTAGLWACSGALVAPNLVLTAHHCLTTDGSDEEFCEVDGTTIAGTNIPVQEVDAAKIAVQTGAHPAEQPSAYGLEIVSTESSTNCRNDLALVVLDRRLEDWPVLPIRLTRPTSVGETMTLIGYGETGETGATVEQTDADVPLERRRRESVPVLDVGANRFGSAAGGVAPGMLLLGPGMCQSDSGGPAVSEATGAIVGVGSVVSDRICSEDTVSAYVQVAEYYGLVLEAFARAGAEPWLEGEATAMQTHLPEDSGCAFAASAAAPSGRSWRGLLLGVVLAVAARQRHRRRSNRSAASPRKPSQKCPATRMLSDENPTTTCVGVVGRVAKNV